MSNPFNPDPNSNPGQAPQGGPVPPTSYGPQTPQGYPNPQGGPSQQGQWGQQPTYGPPPGPGGMPTYGQPGVPPYGPPQVTPGSMWGKRVAAYLIDSLVLLIPYLIVYFIGAAIFFAGSTSTTVIDGTTIQSTTGGGFNFIGFAVIELIGVLLSFAYFAYFDGMTDKGSIGKRVMKIAVRNSETGQMVPPLMAGLRMFLFGIFFALCYIPGILNALWPLWGERGQGWHDIICKTVIVPVV